MPKKTTNAPNTGVSVTHDTVYNRVLAAVLQTCATQESNKLLGYLRSRNYRALLEWSCVISPQMYDCPSSYYRDAQIAALIKKYPFDETMIPDLKPRDRAIKTFLAGEHRCKRYNLRARLKRRRFNRHAQIYEYARTYIEKTIGLAPDLTDILSHCDFTGGASMGVAGNKTNLARKFYASSWTATPSALPYALSTLWTNEHARLNILPGWIKCFDREQFRDIVRSKVDLVSCNEVMFVPKSAKTDRSIAKEPLLNGLIQKGTDIVMREKLRHRGIDLTEQRVNQVLARTGSLGGFNPYCTIDLANASNSLATEVVRDLMPPDWFEFLTDIRSPRFSLDGEDRPYEMFCSMGNGFCFPLQTLIFASVCHAVSKFVNGKTTDDFSVYGDDIIVRQNVALLVIEILRDIGFRTNTDKTFITGPFRESCGSDWYSGQDVRPVHYDERVTDIRHVFALHNSMRKSARADVFFTEARQYLRSLVPGFTRPGNEPGDTGFSVPLDLFMASNEGSWNRDYQCWQWREMISLPIADQLECLGYVEHANVLMYAALRGASPWVPFSVRYMSTPTEVTVSRQYFDVYAEDQLKEHAVKHVAHARNIVRGLLDATRYPIADWLANAS